MTDSITWVGIDAHSDSLRIAMYRGGSLEAEEWTEMADAAGKRLVRKLKALQGRVRCVYEAGPTGYDLRRKLEKAGIDCQVAAPSLIPRKPGDKIKTDRRDARKLARLYRAGELTLIQIPDETREAVRDVLRAREDVLEQVLRDRHHLSRFLLRHGYRFREGKAWSLRHWRWLRQLEMPDANLQMVLDQYRMSLERSLDQLKIFDRQVEQIAGQREYETMVSRLIALRGINTLTAMTILAEIGDLRRFGKASQMMAWIGVVPTEDSSGDRRRQGAITKTGNSHVRRVLVESAWHYQRRIGSPGRGLKRRREGQPSDIVRIAERADQRLSSKFFRLTQIRGKKPGIAAVAVARELAGFIWAIGQDVI